MSENSLQKRVPAAIKEKGQYVIAFGIIASMLVVAQVPVFVIFFFAVFAYLVVKVLGSNSRSETREIFEFYLSANEILRDNERRWYGFEINETIQRGENIIARMSAAPPLVRFAVGALYNRVGEHKSAVKYLSEVLERPAGDELSFVFPTPELRSYVKVLRKIEREPTDAPLTSAAIRALERARRVRGSTLLEESRVRFANAVPRPPEVMELSEATENKEMDATPLVYSEADAIEGVPPHSPDSVVKDVRAIAEGRRKSKKEDAKDPFSDRKPISEVLHDIYDKNVQ